MSLQQHEIDLLRRKRKPSPVRLHHIPSWFRRRCLRRFGVYRPYGTGTMGIEMLVQSLWADWQQGRPRFWDHWGTTCRKGGKAFVVEPYIDSPSDLQALRDLLRWFAGELGCNSFVSRNSYWFPGRTVRGVLFEDANSVPVQRIERVAVEVLDAE